MYPPLDNLTTCITILGNILYQSETQSYFISQSLFTFSLQIIELEIQRLVRYIDKYLRNCHRVLIDPFQIKIIHHFLHFTTNNSITANLFRTHILGPKLNCLTAWGLMRANAFPILELVIERVGNTEGPRISWFLVPKSNEMRGSWIPRTVFSIKP